MFGFHIDKKAFKNKKLGSKRPYILDIWICLELIKISALRPLVGLEYKCEKGLEEARVE